MMIHEIAIDIIQTTKISAVLAVPNPLFCFIWGPYAFEDLKILELIFIQNGQVPWVTCRRVALKLSPSKSSWDAWFV